MEALRRKMDELAGMDPLGPSDKAPIWGTVSPDNSLPELPDGCIDRMREAAINARLDTLLEIADEAEEYDKSFADKVKLSAKRYDYESIFELLGINFK